MSDLRRFGLVPEGQKKIISGVKRKNMKAPEGPLTSLPTKKEKKTFNRCIRARKMLFYFCVLVISILKAFHQNPIRWRNKERLWNKNDLKI